MTRRRKDDTTPRRGPGRPPSAKPKRKRRRGRPKKRGPGRLHMQMRYRRHPPLTAQEATSLLARHRELSGSPPGYLRRERLRLARAALTQALGVRDAAPKLGFVRELLAILRPADVPPPTWLALRAMVRRWPRRIRRLASVGSATKALARLDGVLLRLAAVIGANAAVAAAARRYWKIRRKHPVKHRPATTGGARQQPKGEQRQ